MLPSNIRPLLRPMRIVLGVLAVFVLVQVVLCIPPSYEVRIGSLARSGTPRVIARCWECELVCRILHPSFPALGWSIAQNLLLVPALALRPPQLHHICVAVHGVLWRFPAVDGLKSASAGYSFVITGSRGKGGSARDKAAVCQRRLGSRRWLLGVPSNRLQRRQHPFNSGPRRGVRNRRGAPLRDYRSRAVPQPLGSGDTDTLAGCTDAPRARRTTQGGVVGRAPKGRLYLTRCGACGYRPL
jgi:hypothetical protein